MTAPTRSEPDTSLGLADHLERHAHDFPDRVAIRHADRSGAFHDLTYGRLWDDVKHLAQGLREEGITEGTRTILMTPFGPELFALAFALFRIGAVPVVVDPGMGLRRMLHCYRSVGAEAFIGPPAAHAVRTAGRRTFGSVRTTVTLGRRWFWGGQTLDGLRSRPRRPVAGVGPGGDDLLMVGFTTGSTGPAKGVEYTHRMVATMARQIHAVQGRDGHEVSLVTVPTFGIVDLLLGSTLVLAPLNPAKVAEADPRPLVEALTRFEVTTLAASPALLRVLADHLARQETPLPALRSVVAGGAPVGPELVAALRRVLGGDTAFHVAYGATEALPITSIESAEILADTAARSALGAGTCVGRPVDGTAVRILPVADGPLSGRSTDLAVAPGEIGEIAVAGDSVSRRYHASPTADALHKVRLEHGGRSAELWHRTGDLGYVDDRGRLWFCGRRTQRVRTANGDLHTVCCEGVFNTHPLVRRAALVGVGEPGAQRPVVCVETEPGVDDARWRRLEEELRELAAASETTSRLSLFLRHPGFPVDIRHNAKIGREQLADWAARRLSDDRPRARRSLRAVPLAGWAYLLAGAVHPVDQPVLVALWWIDALLSVVVHAAQLPAALRRARAAGRGRAAAAGLTMLLGATWWRSLPEPPAPATATHRDGGRR
ncbi:fatty acid CoA ligase family protein [Kitasatospora sp. NPDC093102]|uniref:fatty acid CoA ligase family protein n=1 Tax=Kitasatospora sp. NPDC093102 TaxID=3155069 RepID=UPI0034226957